MTKMNDNDLEGISGGFREDNKSLGSYGLNIKCPTCKTTESKNFDPYVLKDPKTNSSEYSCLSCGTKFIVYEKRVILKSDWIQQCKKKGYEYPFK